MASLDNIRRLIVEDFPQEDRQTVEKIAVVLNHFMENVYNVVNGNIEFDNLNQEVIDVKVTVDASGVPTQTTKISTENIRNPQGMLVIRAINSTNRTNYPTSAPFVSYTPIGGNLQRINNISGLQANEEYQLRLLVIG